MKLECENIVLGSSLTAVLYAFKNQYPIFFTTPRRPFKFDYLPLDLDLSFLKISEFDKTLTTFGETKKVGTASEILWERLLFLLSLDGKVPFSNLCRTMRYDGKTITCSNQYSKIGEIDFQNCIYFGEEVANLDITKKLANKHYVCYDWIAFHKGCKHDIDYLNTNDDFVSEVWFYPSKRIDGNTKIKDACVKSTIKSADSDDFSFSETMARFKLVHEMESRGMKGTFNGYTKAGKPKHYKHRTSNIRRDICQPAYEYTSKSSRIKIGEESEQDLLQDLSSSCLAYDRFLMNYEEYAFSRHNTSGKSQVRV